MAVFVRFPARASGAGARRCREAALRRRPRLAPLSAPSSMGTLCPGFRLRLNPGYMAGCGVRVRR